MKLTTRRLPDGGGVQRHRGEAGAGRAPPFASRGPPWQPGAMARETTEPWVQLATRIPKPLHRQLKLHCVHADTSLMEFVVAALKEKLARQGRGGRRTRDDGMS